MATTERTVAWIVAVDVRIDPDDPAMHTLIGRMQHDLHVAVTRLMDTADRRGKVGAIRTTPIRAQPVEDVDIGIDLDDYPLY